VGILRCARKLQQFAIQFCGFASVPQYVNEKWIIPIARRLAFGLPSIG
jgi:hypothetical protein